jgi:hypothetical protein
MLAADRKLFYDLVKWQKVVVFVCEPAGHLSPETPAVGSLKICPGNCLNHGIV